MARAHSIRATARGAALLVVMVSLAVLTALAADLAYETRVSLQIAANGRDELSALYAAKGAVNLARLVIYFQAQLDKAQQAVPQMQASSPQLIPRIQIWNMVPIGAGLADALFGAPGAPEGKAAAPLGSFEAKLEDEGSKVNAQLDGAASSGLLAAQLAAYFDLVGDRRWDFLFDKEDENGLKVSRQDLALYLVDWVDDDTVTSGFVSPPNLLKPVESAFGDENQPYDRGPDRYRVKNARFDSLDELYMVAGVSDTFMAAFGDQLTVYQRRDGKFSLSCSEPEKMVRAARLMADPPGQPAVVDPMMPEKLLKMVRDSTLGCLVTLSPLDFARILGSLQIVVNHVYLDPNNKDNRGAFGPPPGVYRVRASGTAGEVTKKIDAVVTMDTQQFHGQQEELGRLLRWRED